MALSFSRRLMHDMGFRPIAPGEVISAVFHSIYVYELGGVSLDPGALAPFNGSVLGAPYAVAIGTTLNETCKVLVGEEFAEDEADWTKEHRCGPPYALIHFGPTAEHSCHNGHVRMDEAGVTTFDCFGRAKEELRTLENAALPSIVAALSCAFGLPDAPVRVGQVKREVFGLTRSKSVLRDIRLELNASATVSRRVSPSELARVALGVTALAAVVDPKVSRLFQLALEEEDLLKRFLYFFLSIEIETHSAFSAIDHAAHLSRIVETEDRIRETSTAFFGAQRERWKTLNDRFAWCALSVWTHLTDSDVVEFRRLKKIRDGIAHGSLAEPPAESVRAAHLLASKLHLPKCQAHGTKDA